jgi:hypothetical protein
VRIAGHHEQAAEACSSRPNFSRPHQPADDGRKRGIVALTLLRDRRVDVIKEVDGAVQSQQFG